MEFYRFTSSFDGSNVAITQSRSDFPPDVNLSYKIGTSAAKEVFIKTPVNNLYVAILNSTFFVAGARKLYALRVEGQLVETLSIGEGLPATEIFTGLWADKQTVWAATQTSTYMSSDNGWSWTFLLNKRAVGRGLFVESGLLLESKKAKFLDECRYPLTLFNTGLMSARQDGAATPWKNSFEIDLSPATVKVDMFVNDSVVVTPNGFFIMTQSPTKDVKLYFNVWNSHRVKVYCSAPGSMTICAAGYLAYCETIGNIDAGCSCVNKKAEAARLFDTTHLPETIVASLEDVAPCVSRRCKGSNEGAYPVASLGTSCNRPLVICSNMVVNSGNIGSGVTQNNNCGVDNSIPCTDTCPVGLKCFNSKCRLQCDGKCDSAEQTCHDGACIPNNEVPSGFSFLVVGLIAAGVLGLGLLIFFLTRKKGTAKALKP
jgi:hypothetical protein